MHAVQRVAAEGESKVEKLAMMMKCAQGVVEKLAMMMNVLKCCLVGMLFVGSVVAAAQTPDSGPAGKKYPSPSGGTPEPASLLLLAGGAMAYGSLRFRKRLKKGAAEEN